MKKAFTLIELLIVVIVVGVLASVAIPQYVRVLETRRTGEAEDIFVSVRTEQEKRCTMGSQYLGGEEGEKKLASFSQINQSNMKNYDYILGSKGIEAKRSSSIGNYTLRMCYKDGKVCCSGYGCSKLNKDYPACDEDCPNDECESDINNTCANPEWKAAHPDKCCTGNQHWDGTNCVGCPKDPTPCANKGGFYNQYCNCELCDQSTMHSTNQGCDCNFSAEYCYAQNATFSLTENAKGADSYHSCACTPCGKNRKINKGTNSCQCTLSPSACVAEGKVLNSASCSCEPCSAWPGYKGKSSDGKLSSCEKVKSCEDTLLESCKETGAVLKGTWSQQEENYKCECKPCESFSNRKGKTETGKLSDCECCLSESACAKQNMYFDADACACLSCGNGGISKTGKFEDCKCQAEGAVELSVSYCAGIGKIFIPGECSCHSCPGGVRTTATGKEADCKCPSLTVEDCAKSGMVFDEYNCRCVPCSYFGYQYRDAVSGQVSTTKTGLLDNCTSCPDDK